MKALAHCKRRLQEADVCTADSSLNVCSDGKSKDVVNGEYDQEAINEEGVG
ncbi:MAG: hypothetical protein NPIRA04_29270 [Nitrospirales bacterium]|nr:MAG: hypothetical protein NPIRA04_29270 [Nitrospirales bacterium]